MAVKPEDSMSSPSQNKSYQLQNLFDIVLSNIWSQVATEQFYLFRSQSIGMSLDGIQFNSIFEHTW